MISYECISPIKLNIIKLLFHLWHEITVKISVQRTVMYVKCEISLKCEYVWTMRRSKLPFTFRNLALWLVLNSLLQFYTFVIRLLNNRILFLWNFILLEIGNYYKYYVLYGFQIATVALSIFINTGSIK